MDLRIHNILHHQQAWIEKNSPRHPARYSHHRASYSTGSNQWRQSEQSQTNA